MQQQALLNKIPGEMPVYFNKYYAIADLRKLSMRELLDIQNRGEKILKNKAYLDKLPDKGEKFRHFCDLVHKELDHRNEMEQASKLFSELNIASEGQKKLTELEWTKKFNSENVEYIVDSDDEADRDPLKILANCTDVRRKVKYIEPDVSLVKEDDLKEIEGFASIKIENAEETVTNAEIIDIDVKNKFSSIKPKLGHSQSSSHTSSTNSLNLEPHVLHLFEKSVDALPDKQRFKPYKTIKNNIHDPEKELQRKHGKYWEITAATPPPIHHTGVKIIPLEESVGIQTEYLARMKELQDQQAKERLAAKEARMRKSLPEESLRKVNLFFDTYREGLDSDLDFDDDMEGPTNVDSSDEIHDDEDDKGGVTVQFCD